MIGFRHPMQGQCVPVPVCYVSPPTSDCQELLGITYNRLILIDLHSLEHKKTWRYSAMRSWNVNWESKQLRIDHEDENSQLT